MNIGRILLGWLVIAVVIAMIVVALMACGIISVHIEIVPKDEDDQQGDKKELDDGAEGPDKGNGDK